MRGKTPLIENYMVETGNVVRELALNSCSNRELSDKEECVRNISSWSDEELTRYIIHSLLDPNKAMYLSDYLSNTKVFNEVFRYFFNEEFSYILHPWRGLPLDGNHLILITMNLSKALNELFFPRHN
jgi:hypothetical protein